MENWQFNLFYYEAERLDILLFRVENVCAVDFTSNYAAEIIWKNYSVEMHSYYWFYYRLGLTNDIQHHTPRSFHFSRGTPNYFIDKICRPILCTYVYGYQIHWIDTIELYHQILFSQFTVKLQVDKYLLKSILKYSTFTLNVNGL